MNGSEREEKVVLSLNQVLELQPLEKLNLATLAGDPRYETLKKLMQIEVIRARDRAMEIDPAKGQEQRAAMTVAHAMQKFYQNVVNEVELAITEQLSDIKQKALEQELQDQGKIEELYLSQVNR